MLCSFLFLLRQARQKEALPQKRAAARCAIFRVWGFPTGKRREEKLTSLYCLRISKFADPAYKDLSTGAKLLYSLMLDRVMLSTLNEWKDKRGRIFIYFTIKEIMREIECCRQTAVNLLDELEKADLIERKKQGDGQTKPDICKTF